MLVQPPKIGDVIRMRSWHGVVLDVFQNEAGKTILQVQTVRNLYRRLNPEFIEFDAAPETISPATLNELRDEAQQYQNFLDQRLDELTKKATDSQLLDAEQFVVSAKTLRAKTEQYLITDEEVTAAKIEGRP